MTLSNAAAIVLIFWGALVPGLFMIAGIIKMLRTPTIQNPKSKIQNRQSKC